jgi:hypothetical protein
VKWLGTDSINAFTLKVRDFIPKTKGPKTAPLSMPQKKILVARRPLGGEAMRRLLGPRC